MNLVGEDGCSTCSIDGLPIHHDHFSNRRARLFAGVEGTNQEHFCVSCLDWHVPYPGDRTKVLITDILHNYFVQGNDHENNIAYEGDKIHIEHVSIADGQLPDLFHAFHSDMGKVGLDRPFDVVIAAGYSDLVKNRNRHDILESFRDLEKSIHLLGMHREEVARRNTVAIASLMYPPKLAWLPGDGTEPRGYQNKLKKIEWLNKEIVKINYTNGILDVYPGLHSYGTRTAFRFVGTGEQKEMLAHRWNHWEPKRKREKLLLIPERMMKAGRAVNNYFLHQTL